MIEVLQPGVLTTVQDSGRNGFEAYGVPRSGFFDPYLAAIANRLVGNPLDTAVLEFAMMGPTLIFHDSGTIAITGFKVDFEGVPEFRAVSMKKGDQLQFKAMKGWFGYIGISGGIVCDRVLGSASTHFAAGIGKRLAKGDSIQTGPGSKEQWELSEKFRPSIDEDLLLLVPGHHTQNFRKEELQIITEKDFVISTSSNRMGIRLDGPFIQSSHLKRSVPALIGALQVPGSGMPIILGPEGPTTGGYPQIGILTRTSWTVLAGRSPGTGIRFGWVQAEDARLRSQKRRQLFTTPEPWVRI